MEQQLEQQLEKILPEDLARTFESAYHVLVQGNHDHMDDLLKHGGTLLKKAAQRLTPTQLILGIAAIAAVAVVVVNQASQPDQEEEDDKTSAEALKEDRAKKAADAHKKDQPKSAQEHQGH
ncbi:hypothetical protein SAMN02745146_2959 [Hymenobacter daecheongensis DSM 21074]|uniref:Recombination associated protein RdgC n=1 Tax=Hymenobacter daecheongensis DSM 21074 TaxID=1121955 RepID=A0A1M6ISR6_9BACT|nr:hypothetical protein [Hymenobacter daecheongensis]SHJ37513.1 hypothetical protein SAMN02745146_2959 [Hymenobacter daecheongensis DSM 21074]